MLLKHKSLILWRILILGVTLQLHLPEVSMQQLYLPRTFLQPYLPQQIFYPYENYIISQCEEETLNLINSENLYADKTGKYNFPSFQGLQNKIQDRIVYEKEELQMPFECISRYILNGTYNAGIEEVPRFRDLVSRCKNSQPQITCDPLYPYRSFDGTCNNLVFPLRGNVQTCARRLMPASYEGVSGFRISKCGIQLPSPRSISRILMTDIPLPNPLHSNILTYFAQFLTHDITDLPTSHVKDLVIDCCSNLFRQHPQCAPILLSPEDPFYSQFNTTCFNFVRVAPCPSCVLGQLIVQNREAGKFLPPDFELGFCGLAENFEYCFKTGDRRANMHAPLMTFQTIFLREHNRLATILRELNSHWSGETIFREARKNPQTAFDLSAVDIQRGRDAGVPSYTEVLNYLSGSAINIETFEDLLQVFKSADIELLKTVYCDPRDIDFLVGMFLERVQDNMMISKSSAKIIAQQFRDLKFGDRFYVEHLANFNENQLSTLKDVTIAKLFCNNAKFTHVQQYAMRLPSSSNLIKPCYDIPELNMYFWKDG